jgi:hypothetical protein
VLILLLLLTAAMMKMQMMGQREQQVRLLFSICMCQQLFLQCISLLVAAAAADGSDDEDGAEGAAGESILSKGFYFKCPVCVCLLCQGPGAAAAAAAAAAVDRGVDPAAAADGKSPNRCTEAEGEPFYDAKNTLCINPAVLLLLFPVFRPCQEPQPPHRSRRRVIL